MITKNSNAVLAQAGQIIRTGGLIAFRTDTFYGLGADPFNREAIIRLNRLKARDDKPILVVISDASHAARFIASGSDVFNIVSGRLWPGALTLIMPADPAVPVELTAGTGTVGLRLPDDEAVRAFVDACGGALTATSANRAGDPPARTAQEVARAFPDGLDLIVDDGPATGDKPSTILNLSGPNPQVIREGVIPVSEIARTLGKLE